uniref:BACK domain-containing protein n=1 Tax=Panagrolaimus sp. PS1159 TaxID=55785 RepID=A0AC35FWR3_9BILA
MSQSTANSEHSPSGSYLSKMQQERFNIFKSQDPENEHFDVSFEIDGKVFSDRWTRNGEAVKIIDYCYDDFYQFLSFIYIEYCKLNDKNVFQLTDMAECYGVKLFKEYCDKFLSKMQYNVERIDKMVIFCQKYSMTKMEAALKDFIYRNFDGIISTKEFLSYEKSVVQYLSLIDYSHHKKNERLFEAVYKWTEQQIMAQKDLEDIEEGEIFDVLKEVKNEFCATFPHISSLDKTMMSIDFLMNFVVENGFDLTPAEFNAVYKKLCGGGFGLRYYYGEKSYFKDVYFLAKKQALKKQEMDFDENFSLADSVKSILSKVIPLVEFSKMDKTFVMDFVVAKGILTKEEAIFVKNDSKVITGVFKDDIGIGRTIGLKSRYYITQSSDKIIRFLDLKFRMPKTPSIVKKTDGIEWYLCLEADEILTFKHHTIVNSSDYLLAEMKSETDFSLTPNETTTIQANFNSFNDILE